MGFWLEAILKHRNIRQVAEKCLHTHLALPLVSPRAELDLVSKLSLEAQGIQHRMRETRNTEQKSA